MLPARADVRIVSSPGGAVDAYLAAFARVRQSGERVVIDGPCLSACTLVLSTIPRSRICVTRRAVLGRLSAGPAPVSELARPFSIALPSFTQHLDVLERCGLVRSRKVGRVRTYRLVPQPLSPLANEISRSVCDFSPA
jgi:DNA-binding transcriptional ArsR family regulator